MKTLKESILSSTGSGIKGTKIKIGRTEYTLLGTFIDDNEEFFIGKRMVHDKYPEYCVIGWNEKDSKYYVHS